MTGALGRWSAAVARATALVCAAVAWEPVGFAQTVPQRPAAEGVEARRVDPPGGGGAMNPIAILQNASEAISGGQAGGTAAGEPRIGLNSALSIVILLTVLSIAPALLVLTTSFTRIVIVLSLLRQAIGTQSLPPSQVVVGLAMFLTFLVMSPTFERINREAIGPLQSAQIDQLTAWKRACQPMRDFMFEQIEYSENWGDVYMLLSYRGVDVSDPGKLKRSDVDMLTLIPAFVLSELKVAFLMGFRLYMPFLVIDLVISSVLISMGMLMLPPVLISLPFKLLLFVLVDGWQLVAGNLLNSFAVPGVPGIPGVPGMGW